MLQAQYFKKAEDAYQSGNLKLSLVYLKKLDAWDRKSIELLVNSSYDLWKQNSGKEDTGGKGDEEAAEVVQQAFTILLSSSNISSNLILPWDYLRLSHVYIIEGNLVGAAEVMNIASAKGHMEDLLVVTQSCFIMNGLNKPGEVQRIVTYIASSLFELSAAIKSNESDVDAYDIGHLPVYYLCIICAAFLQKRTKFRHEKEKKQSMIDFENLLREAYFYATNEKESSVAKLLKWYSDSQLWMRCAEKLDGGPLLLLAEAFYWEAYIRESLSNEALTKLINSMRRFKRADDVPRVMSDALVVNAWNIKARNTMKEIELSMVPQPDQREWTKLFDSEDIECAKIQASFRGWSLRCKWPQLLPIYKKHRQNFLDKMQLSAERYEQYLQKYHGILIQRWLRYVRDWQALKWRSALRIQTRFRTHAATGRYHDAIARVQLANKKYFQLCQHQYVSIRMQAMRRWQDHLLMRRKHAAVKVISDFLFLYGYNQLLVKGMNEVMMVLRVYYRQLRQRMWRHWRTRYLLRQKKHARTTIRFFLRDVFRRIEEKKQEEKLRLMEQILVAKKEEISFERNYLPMKREYFTVWRVKFLDRRKHHAVVRMVYTLQQKFLQKKAREVLHFRAIRRESQRAYLIQRRQKQLYRILFPWQRNAAAIKIQRFVRLTIGRGKISRWTNIIDQVHEQQAKRRVASRKLTIKRWQKFVFLWKREKIRAVRLIKATFRKAVLLSKLKRYGRRRPGLIRMLFTIHLRHLASIFRFWRDRAKIEAKMKAAKLLADSMYAMMLRREMKRWRRHLQQQWYLQQLRKITVFRGIDRQFWPGAHLSVEVHARRGQLRTQTADNIPLVTKSGYRTGWDRKYTLHPWEHFVPTSLHLLSLTTLNKARVFHKWMAAYRCLLQFRYDGSYYQARLFEQALWTKLHQRQVANVKIQSWCRQLQAWRRVLHVRLLEVYAGELQARRHQRTRWQCWCAMMLLQRRRQKAWPLLVSILRIQAAKQEKHRRIKILAQQEAHVRQINRSSFQRTLVRKIFHMWIAAYCHRVVQPSYDIASRLLWRYRPRQPVKQKPQLSTGSHEEDDDNSIHTVVDSRDVDDENDEDMDLNPRLRKLLQYQKRLSVNNSQQSSSSNSLISSVAIAPSRSMSANHLMTATTAEVNVKSQKETKKKTKKKDLGNALSRYASSSVMFFRSEAFHSILQQVRVSQLFLYDHNAANQLHEQEIYFCLQHAQVVVLKNFTFVAVDEDDDLSSKPTVLPLRYVCNAFRGQRIVIQDSSLSLLTPPEIDESFYHNDHRYQVKSTSGMASGLSQEQRAVQDRSQQIQACLHDLVSGCRRFYESEVIDRAKWPLTLPSASVAPPPMDHSTNSRDLGNQHPSVPSMPMLHFLRCRMSHAFAVYVARLFLPVIAMGVPGRGIDVSSSTNQLASASSSSFSSAMAQSQAEILLAVNNLHSNNQSSNNLSHHSFLRTSISTSNHLLSSSPNNHNGLHSSSSMLSLPALKTVASQQSMASTPVVAGAGPKEQGISDWTIDVHSFGVLGLVCAMRTLKVHLLRIFFFS